MQNRPLYTIGVVADMFQVHPETLRVWERYGLVTPYRRNGQRLYTDQDLKRLGFLQELINKGLNLAGVTHYLGLYPCWLHDDCPKCMRRSTREGCAKPCWKEKGSFCQVSVEEPDMCEKCDYQKPNFQNKKNQKVG
jgi:MerR family transcriptional regulator/heat shock protein HspR